tara:strand:- start:2175 stop:2276 length:102 start_codon:yes stop_codon:yes gene_type:complete
MKKLGIKIITTIRASIKVITDFEKMLKILNKYD